MSSVKPKIYCILTVSTRKREKLWGEQLEAIAMRHREHIDFKYGSEGYCKRVLQNDAGKFPGVSAKLTKTDDKQLLKADYDSHVF